MNNEDRLRKGQTTQKKLRTVLVLLAKLLRNLSRHIAQHIIYRLNSKLSVILSDAD